MRKCCLMLQLVMVTGGFVPPNPFFIAMQNTRVDVCSFKPVSTSLHGFAEGRPVYGVQPIGNEIYVIRDSTPYIEVFDRFTFQRKPNLSVENLGGPYDMVQSGVDLFIADWFNAVNLTKVRVPTGNATRWSFHEKCSTTLGLAGSKPYTAPNILVTASVSQLVKKFGPNGSLAREFTVNISNPRHTIKVSQNRYAVCHGYGRPPELHRVCLVTEAGEPIKCYGGIRGSGVGQLNIPSRLELSRRNCILVADTGNKRVVLLNQNLKFVRNLISKDLDGPYRLFLDEKQRLLYVADNTVNDCGIAVKGRIKVFQV